ncbi:MAG: glycoside hydrolase family 127 protein, partial [Bryobacteraceae bacterium]|nr:glycoside hydrolase family 127 protein [Bryobacteraceae bacterium]
FYDNNELTWKLEDGTPIQVKQSTRYPWDGTVEFTVTPKQTKEFTLFLRIPSWSQATDVKVDGRRVSAPVTAGQYFALKRQWKPGETVLLTLDMKPQVLMSHPSVTDNQGRVAIKRGPVVYAVEQTDQAGNVSVLETGFKLSPDPARDFTAEFRKNLLGGVVVLKHRGVMSARPFASLPLYRAIDEMAAKPGSPVDLTLIPYYSFLNRGPAAMQVWTKFYR